MVSLGIIDYGSGNFRSVWDAFFSLDANLQRISSPAELESHTHLVLPGVGSFVNAMRNLHSMGIVEPLREILTLGRIQFLGICVGMQVLGDFGLEGERVKGLGLIKGTTRSLANPESKQHLRLPHIGWNQVEAPKDSILFEGMTEEEREFYFVHSFHLDVEDTSTHCATSEYGRSFASAVEKNNIFGVQFHPEKSQRSGLLLLDRFLKS